ncbi:MAG TPA: heavy metal-associated domain-containing protein [bacterium]|nr:heavy metal-associated domain-containing protein [bacterium]
MNRISIALLAILFAPAMLGAAELQILKMKIEGMTCGLCEAKVKKQLSSLCKEVTIDREKGEGICTYEETVKPDQILSEANKTGFKTTKLN